MVSLKLHKKGKGNTHPEYKLVYSQIYRRHGGQLIIQYYSRKHVVTVWKCCQPSPTDGR